MTSILTQFVAHEVAYINITRDGEIDGNIKNISRLGSLLHFSVKWYSVISLIFFAIIIPVGFIFFSEYGNNANDIEWKLPWLLICIASAIKLFQSPFTSILMGLGKVTEMSKVTFYQQIILPIVVWLGLILNWDLYVVGISSILSAIWWNVYIYKTDLQRLLIKIWKINIAEKVNYSKEIFPFQWKIAVSWISGYFIFQLFNPVLFATDGPVVAGQMGMTLTVLNAIQALSMSWLNTKVPEYSRLIALKDYCTLDNLFNITMKQMLIVCFVLLSLMFFGIVGLRVFEIRIGDNLVGDRFIDYIPMLLMMIVVIINQYVSSWATYLRCHKQEPFLLNSLLGGIFNCLSTIFLGNLFGLNGIVVGYFLITLIFLPWGYYIYISKKKEWHAAI